MSEKVLVVGGAGYVGSEIAKIHLQNGYQVMVFDDLSSGSLGRLPQDENLEFYKGSLVDFESISDAVKKFQPGLVFHMAAVHYIPQCINDPNLVLDTNFRGTLNVIDALNRLSTKPKLVFTSSAAVYGAVTPAPQQTSGVPQPCDIYGYSKLVGEHLVTSRYDNYIIARLFNVFGDDDPVPHLIPSIVRQLENDTIELGNPDSERDFIYVKDAARAFTALGQQGTARQTYNIGSGICHSVEQVCQKLKKMSGSKAKFVFQATERRKVDPKVMCADISDIIRDTDWRPNVTFEQGLKTVLHEAASESATAIKTKAPTKPLHIENYIAVISDFDDTIIDNGDPTKGGLHEISRMEALREVGEATGIDILGKVTPEMSVSAIVNAPVHISEGAFWWLLTETDVIPKHHQYDPKHPLIQQLSKSKQRKYMELLVTHAKATPGAQHFFQSLHNNGFEGRMAIASSGCRDDIIYFLNNHNFDHLFHEKNIVAREDVSKLKPHPESFLTALEKLGVSEGDAKRVLAFEDDPKGIIAAKQAGLTTCAITTRFTKEELLSRPTPPDFVASNFHEYTEIFGFQAANAKLDSLTIRANSR